MKLQDYDHENGWLAPDGAFHVVKDFAHCAWCIERSGRCASPQCRMEHGGWFKLSQRMWVICYPHKTTQKQMDFIWDWYALNKIPPDEFIKMLKEKDDW